MVLPEDDSSDQEGSGAESSDVDEKEPTSRKRKRSDDHPAAARPPPGSKKSKAVPRRPTVTATAAAARHPPPGSQIPKAGTPLQGGKSVPPPPPPPAGRPSQSVSQKYKGALTVARASGSQTPSGPGPAPTAANQDDLQAYLQDSGVDHDVVRVLNDADLDVDGLVESNTEELLSLGISLGNVKKIQRHVKRASPCKSRYAISFIYMGVIFFIIDLVTAKKFKKLSELPLALRQEIKALFKVHIVADLSYAQLCHKEGNEDPPAKMFADAAHQVLSGTGYYFNAYSYCRERQKSRRSYAKNGRGGNRYELCKNSDFQR